MPARYCSSDLVIERAEDDVHWKIDTATDLELEAYSYHGVVPVPCLLSPGCSVCLQRGHPDALHKCPSPAFQRSMPLPLAITNVHIQRSALAMLSVMSTPAHIPLHVEDHQSKNVELNEVSLTLPRIPCTTLTLIIYLARRPERCFGTIRKVCIASFVQFMC